MELREVRSSSTVVRDRVELGVQVIKEEWFDHAEDVLLTRVVRADVVARFVVHHTLEHAPEDGG